MPQLHLIGTLPQDPDGAARLDALLAEIRPAAIAVEGSRAEYERARAAGHAGLEAALEGAALAPAHGAADFLARLFSAEHTHFEQWAATRYAARQGIPLTFLDPDDPSNWAAEPERPPASPELLAALAAHDWRAAFAQDYDRARAELEGKACLEFLIPPHEHPAHAARDAALAGRIEALMRDAPESRLAVVCSLTHLYFSEARLTLYSLLYERTTCRYLTDGQGALVDHRIAVPWAH